jgi:hypothetical protein
MSKWNKPIPLIPAERAGTIRNKKIIFMYIGKINCTRTEINDHAHVFYLQ